MKLWKRFFQKMSLLKKLLFIFILVMIAPLCLTTVSFYQRTEQRLLEITYENMNSSIQQISSNVRAQMEQLQREVLKLILQPFVENAINHAQTAGDSPLHITIRAYAVCRDKKNLPLSGGYRRWLRYARGKSGEHFERAVFQRIWHSERA